MATSLASFERRECAGLRRNAKEVEKATSMDLAHEIEKTIDPGGEMKQALAEPSLADHSVASPETPPAPSESTEPSAATAMEPTPATAAPVAEPIPAPEEAVAEMQPKSGTHA